MAPMIDNPEFKGEWNVKRIANPKFVDDDSLYSFEDFGFIGFDLWQVKGGSIFDKIIITDDEAEADKLAEKWKALNAHEKEDKKKAEDTKKEEDKSSDADSDDDDDDADDEEEA